MRFTSGFCSEQSGVSRMNHLIEVSSSNLESLIIITSCGKTTNTSMCMPSKTTQRQVLRETTESVKKKPHDTCSWAVKRSAETRSASVVTAQECREFGVESATVWRHCVFVVGASRHLTFAARKHGKQCYWCCQEEAFVRLDSECRREMADHWVVTHRRSTARP